MDINELESYRLSDAVKFNDKLNPRLWSNEHLKPEVKQTLLAIADDFREFLGIKDLDVQDITVSGSNAAYTYTPHSDIDLHLVVDLSKVCSNEVYKELFNAKKYQYNDEHNYRIGPYDVELYVQDSNEPHHSQGIYSLVNDDWTRVPTRRHPTVDDISVKSKYEDLGNRIEQALKSGNVDSIRGLWNKIKNMRQTGLDKTGEFGPENLAFKLLRRHGLLTQLKAAVNHARDRELSLNERRKKKKQVRYGYGGYWAPGFSFGDSEGGDGGGESIAETQEPKDIKEILPPFIKSCAQYLGLEKTPKIILKRDPEWTRRNGTFGRFDTDTRSVILAVSGRHTLDILRTLAHELTHARQDELATMPVDAGETGSPYEDDANAQAGRIMRHWVDQYPEFFKDVQLEDYDPNGTPPGPEFKPTMPAGTVKVDVSDVYDWYKLGQHVSNLKGLGQHDFGAGPPSTIMAFGSEKEEHKYIDALKKTGLTTTDIDPVDVNQPKGMPRQKTDPTYNVNEALDQPYKILRWEKGDYGDVDAIARLDDNTFLSIMFNKGFSQETKEEAWSVEFYRNNSQEVTGEGDEFRVFATVLSAIQTFISDRVPGAIGKYKPNKVYFSASKQVEPGQKEQSRAGLYDSLIQRYARAWGFTASRSDTGNKVMYELNRIKPVAEAQEQCPECGGPMFSNLILAEKKDACYNKVRSRYKVWPSAYASGALVQCRKKGAANWGNKSKNEGVAEEQLDEKCWDTHKQVGMKNKGGRMVPNCVPKESVEEESLDENLRDWFKEKWVRFGPDGKIRGDCARGDDSEGKPKCLPQSKAHSLGKKGRASAAARKRREDPNPERSGKAINVNTKKKNESMTEATGYIPVNSKEAHDPRYSMAITQDIKPGEVQRQAAKMGFKTDAAGVPPLLMKLQNQLQEIKTGVSR